MSNQLRGILIVATVLFLAACATQPVYNVNRSTIASSKPNPSVQEISKAIVRAGSGLGWNMNPDRPGHILGTLNLRTHAAVVDIDYDAKSHSIKYKDSTNLDYSGANIHKNYNGWIQNLDKAIQIQLNNL